MSIKAKLKIPEQNKEVYFENTIIDWNKNQIIHQIDGIPHVVSIDHGKLTALKNILKDDIDSIPNIFEVNFEFE